MLSAVRIVAPVALAFLCLASAAHAQAPDRPDAFAPCEDAGSYPSLNGTLCASVDVPLDHAAPDGDAIEIFVRKFPAAGVPKGQLWMVAGGPGESGASFYPFIATVRAAAPGFDLIVPDHRGTGFSTRLCPDEEHPASAAGTALAGEEWGSCFGALNADAPRTRAFTISNAAHDLSLLIGRFDTGRPTYLYGVSYGTQLVLRMLAIDAPGRLNGVILDSLVPPERDTQRDLSHRSAVTDAVGRQVLRDCDARPECGGYFIGGMENALRALLDRDDIEALTGPRPKMQFAVLLDFPEARAMLPQIIAGLQADDPAWLNHAKRRIADIGALLEPYPQAGSSIPLVSLISRSENNARPGLTRETIAQEEAGTLFASPLPGLLLQGGTPTYSRDRHFGTSPTRMPRTIVLHGTRDPKTPYEAAQAHVAALAGAGEVTLVPVDGAPHFILMTAPDAFEGAVRGFLDEGAGAAE